VLRTSLLRAVCLFVAVPVAAGAQEVITPASYQPRVPFRPAFGWILEGGVEMGGSRVAETTFTDGSTQTMQAGQGGTFAVGAEVRPRFGSPFALRGTVGWKFVTTAATNASIGLTRVPMELVASYSLNDDWRVGVGAVRHSSIEFDAGGFGPDVSFDDANGATVEVGWRWLAFTYTAMEYTDEFGGKFNASSGGVTFIWMVWPRRPGSR